MGTLGRLLFALMLNNILQQHAGRREGKTEGRSTGTVRTGFVLP